jgi:hypothetical protein
MPANTSYISNLTTDFRGHVRAYRDFEVDGTLTVEGFSLNSMSAKTVTAASLDSGGQVFNVLAFGATGDGSTDDLTAISRATNAAAIVRGSVLLFPATAGGAYSVSGTVTIPLGVSAVMEQPVSYSGVAVTPIIVSGSTGTVNSKVHLRLGARRATRDWTDDGIVAVKLVNLQHARAEIFEARDATIGVLARSDGQGFAYNDISLGELINNKNALVLESAGTSPTTGYVNENTWRNGNFVVDSNVNTTTSRYGAIIRSADGNYVLNNNNVFIKPSFQLKVPTGGAESVGVVINHGLLNHFRDARFESNGSVARFANASARNHIQTGYCDESEFLWDSNNTSAENIVTGGNAYAQRNLLNNPVFTISDIGYKARGVSGTAVMIEGVSWGQTSTAVQTAASGTGITYDADFITVTGTRGMGVYVSTTSAKEFLFKRHGTSGGRVGVVCFDSSSVITNGASQAIGAPNAALTDTPSQFGGCFKTGTDKLEDVYFRVTDGVSKVWAFVQGGSSNATITGFGIYTLPGYSGVRVWPGVQTQFEFSRESTPGQFAADQNNLETGDYSLLRLSTDASRSISGFTGVARDRRIRVANIGSFPIQFSNANGGSATVNRILTGTGAAVTLNADAAADFLYDATSSRWRITSFGATTNTPSVTSIAVADGTAIGPSIRFSSESSLGFYRSANSTLRQSYGTFWNAGPVWSSSGISIGNSTAGGTLIPAISSTSSLVAAFVVQGSSSSFTVVTWAAAQPGDQILTTIFPDAAVSSMSSGIVLHSHCTVAGRVEMRLSNVSTLAQNQSSKSYVFTRISAF